MSKADMIESEATISVALPNAMFKVKLDNGVELLGTISGKIRRNSINIIPGDRVKIEISPYDLTRCRIVFRIKKESQR